MVTKGLSIPDEKQVESSFEFGTASPPRERGPLTVALLFYLVTAGGILSACLRTLVGHDNLSQEALHRVLLAGTVVGFVGGAILGFYFLRKRHATLICSVLGIVIGAVAGGLALVQGNHFTEIALIAFGGCWLLMVVMLLSARYSSPPNVLDR